MIEPQLAIGATHDMRIFTGSALWAVPAPNRPSAHTPASASFMKRIVSSRFAGLALRLGKLHAANGKIVGGPTDFGKPHGGGIFTRHAVQRMAREKQPLDWWVPVGKAMRREKSYAVVGSLVSWCQINSRRRTSAIALTST